MPTSLSRSPESLATELGKARDAATEEINQKIGEIRRRYITAIPGQDMLYKSKEEEARTVLAAADPNTLNEEDFPFLSSEIGVNGADLEEVATLVLYLSNQWKTIGSQLENIRLGHVKQIKDLTTVAGISVVMQSFYDSVEPF